MKLLEPIPEAAMVAAFLRAEIDAARYGPRLQQLLSHHGRGPSIIRNPNLESQEENEFRAWLLSEVRGYRRNQDVFTDMPEDVQWYRAVLEPSDLDAVMCLDYDYWTDITGGTRLMRDAAKRAMSGGPGAQEAEMLLGLADRVRAGMRLPEAILLHNPATGELVVLEGHKRMAAYLTLDPLPSDLLRVIVGRSERIDK